jgi:hypothetical protein
MTKSDIFWKSWWWSAVAGAGIAILFLIITALPLFGTLFRTVPFVDSMVVLSVVGCYVGAGYVGSRIAAKYYTGDTRYAGWYVRFSVLSFAVLVAVAFSPLSFLMVAWSFIAPACVLLTLRGMTPRQSSHAAPARTRGRKRATA